MLLGDDTNMDDRRVDELSPSTHRDPPKQSKLAKCARLRIQPGVLVLRMVWLASNNAPAHRMAAIQLQPPSARLRERRS